MMPQQGYFCGYNDVFGTHGDEEQGAQPIPSMLHIKLEEKINIGHCSNKLDVFAFGVINLSLISKKAFTKEDRQASALLVDRWSRREYNVTDPDSYMMIPEPKPSLVHQSLTTDPHFCAADGHEMTLMAYLCVNELDAERPTMKQVLKSLLRLQVVKKHSDFIGVNKLISSNED